MGDAPAHEVREALAAGLQIVLVHETDVAHGTPCSHAVKIMSSCPTSTVCKLRRKRCTFPAQQNTNMVTSNTNMVTSTSTSTHQHDDCAPPLLISQLSVLLEASGNGASASRQSSYSWLVVAFSRSFVVRRVSDVASTYSTSNFRLAR